MARHIFRVYGNILPAYAGYCRKHMCHNHTQSNEYEYVYVYKTRESNKVRKQEYLVFFGKGTKNADTRFLEMLLSGKSITTGVHLPIIAGGRWR